MTLSNAYLTRMPIGFIGMVNRNDHALLQPEMLDPAEGPTVYGTFVKMTTGKICKLAGGEAVGDIVGLLSRPYPVQETSTPGGVLGTPGAPNLALPADIMKRGYMIVAFAGVTAAKGGQVYVCINVAGGNAVGEIFEDADGGNNIAVTNCFFMGAADNGVVEVSYNVER
jgi:hypothetical protein